MGVESKFYIIPQASSLRPSPQKVLDLIVALRSKAFLCDPKAVSFAPDAHGMKNGGEGFTWTTGRRRDKGQGSLDDLLAFLVTHGDSDVLLRWNNFDLAQSGLKYPLTVLPESDEVYYDIDFHLVAETAYHTSEVIEPFQAIRCACGEEIAELEPDDSDPFYCARLPVMCMKCHKPNEFENLSMTYRDPWTGEEKEGFGGVTYRFAVVVDCGKNYPDRTAQVAADFLGIIQRTLGVKTREIGDVY